MRYDIKIQWTIVFVLTLMASSCGTYRSYKSPEVTGDNLYRGLQSKDTTSIAYIPYTQMFKDAHLKALISEGISNNNNLKVAVARIKKAGAYLGQSRAELFPSLSAGVQVTEQKLSDNKVGVWHISIGFIRFPQFRTGS